MKPARHYRASVGTAATSAATTVALFALAGCTPTSGPSGSLTPTPTAAGTPTALTSSTPTVEPTPTATATTTDTEYPERPLHTGEYTLEEIFNSGDYVYVTVYAEMLGPVSDPQPHILCTRSGGGYHECHEFLLADVFVTFEAFVPVGGTFQFGASDSDVPLGGAFHVVGEVDVPPGIGAYEMAYFDIQFDYGDSTTVGGIVIPGMFVK